MRKVNKAGLDLIKSFEGLELKAYQDSVGVWTIGYGHTEGVKRGDVITRVEAERIFEEDINKFAASVESLIHHAVTENQFAALVSLAFNVGIGNFTKSTLLKMVNSGHPQAAAEQFLVWNRAGGQVLNGLTRRRKAERALFLDKPLERVAATDDIQQEEDRPEPDSSPPLPQESPAPTQQVDAGGAATQVVVQPNALDSAPVVSNPFDEPIKILKGKSADLMNYVLGLFTTGGTGSLFTGRPGLAVFFFSLVFVGVVVIIAVNHHKKIIEARTKADPRQYPIQFVKE